MLDVDQAVGKAHAAQRCGPGLRLLAVPFNGAMAGHRKTKLESFLKREIATTVAQELRDPRPGIVTIARVELTPDFSRCTAYYTILRYRREVSSDARCS